MDILTNNNVQLVRQDFRELKKHIFQENNVNDWDKIIIIYNFYLFFSHLYLVYVLMDIISKDNSTFIHQFRNVYVFFFILCNMKNSYAYFIFNVSKIDPILALNILKHTKEYII